MNSELLALIEAFDATKECPPAKSEEGFRLRALYQSRLKDFLERHPTLSREMAQRMIECAHARWVKAQRSPSSIPPKA